mgnify:CR=1 FL=1
MKINEETKDWIDFGEIHCGDVFRTEDDDYYMKVDGSRQYNAVRVSTGQLARFDGELVSPVRNAEMTIKF